MSKLQIEEVISEMMGEPPEIFVVTVELCNGKFKFYTFDLEEYQVMWVEQLAINARQWNIEKIMFGESVLNYNDNDSHLMVVH